MAGAEAKAGEESIALLSIVMAGPDPAIHGSRPRSSLLPQKAWIAGSSPAMTM
jgi:hypothetical protein